MKAAIVAAVAFSLTTQAFPADPPKTLSAIQTIAAARGGEALDQCERIQKDFWPTMQTGKLALLVLEPGEWAVLLNHPDPPAGFAAAAPVRKERMGTKPFEGEPEPPEEFWPVAVAGPQALAGLDPAPRHSLMLAGRRTAVVLFNSTTVPSTSFSGWPPAEATINRMVRMVWLAHLDDLQGEPAVGPAIWDYTADAEDLSLISVEQRLMARIMRISYDEKTMAKYRELFAMWLAVRHARIDRNPGAVAMEEAVERRAGLADFTETVVYRVMDSAANEVRGALEKVDPFYDRYHNAFILRVTMLNYPLVWYPTTPAEALQHARATGAALAFADWPIAVKWDLDYFPRDGAPPVTLREVAEKGLGDDWPADANARTDLLERARNLAGYDTTLPVMKAILEEGAQTARHRAGDAAESLRVSLSPRKLMSYHADLDDQRWLGGRRYRLAGPLDLAFEGGKLTLDPAGALQVETEAGRPSGLAPSRLILPLTGSWTLTVGGEVLTAEKPGRKGQSLAGPLRLEGPGVTLTLDGARVTPTPHGFDVADRADSR